MVLESASANHSASYFQVAFIHLEQNRLISPAQMMLPLPASNALWQAPDAYVWRNILLAKETPQGPLPLMTELFANMPALDTLGDAVDKNLCTLASCHALAHEVWQFRQQSQLLCSWQAQGRQDRWLGHLNRKKDLLDDLTTISDYCELNDNIPAEVMCTVEFLTMSLHVSVQDILTFSGKSGEEEARRVSYSIGQEAFSMKSQSLLTGRPLKVYKKPRSCRERFESFPRRCCRSYR